MAMARTRELSGGGELTHSCTGQDFAIWQNSLLRIGEYCRKRRKKEWEVRGQALLKHQLKAMYCVGRVARDDRVGDLCPRS